MSELARLTASLDRAPSFEPDGFRMLEGAADIPAAEAEIENTILPRRLVFRNETGEHLTCFAEAGRLITHEDGHVNLSDLHGFVARSNSLSIKADIVSEQRDTYPERHTPNTLLEFHQSAQGLAIALIVLEDGAERTTMGEADELSKLRKLVVARLIETPDDDHFAAFSTTSADPSLVVCALQRQLVLMLIERQKIENLHTLWTHAVSTAANRAL